MSRLLLLLSPFFACACTSSSEEQAGTEAAPAGASPEPVAMAAPGSAQGPSLVLLTVDTTRADRIGAYGTRVLAPR